MLDMQKKGELSRLAVNLLIGSLIIILGGIIFFIVRGWNEGQDIYDDENIDLKISQVKKVNDNTLDLTLRRGVGEGEFVGLSFQVSDGRLIEVIRINSSMPENQTGNFSLKFISMNASRVKKISVTPIYLNEEGVEVIGNVKDEYVTPNTCSNYCPTGSQCGLNDCGMQCGNGCGSGYLCLNYKCIKQQTFSGGGGSGGSSGGSTEDNEEGEEETEIPCTPTTCLTLGRTCGTVSDGCAGTLNCGSCLTGFSCAVNGTCMKESEDCIASTTCSTFGKNCGTISDGCSGSLNCGACSTGYTCFNNVCINSNDIGDENIQQQNSDCGDILDYQCGTRTICDKLVNFGNCPNGYYCNNNLCIAKNDLSCTGVTCPSGEYCSHGVCLLDVSGDTYFVATWGNDSNPGTFEQPFYNWQRVVGEMQPGDIAYFRGGVWQPSGRPEDSREFGMSICGPESYNTAVSGTALNPIRYFNYPGEKPILDGSFIEPDEYRWSSGISLEAIEHIHLRGLTVRHVHQSPPDFSHEKPYSEVYGISSATCANIHYENMVSHDIDGRGFQHWSGAWGILDMESPEDEMMFEYDNTSWINCDAYNIFDRYSMEPGNAGDAWKVQGYYGNHYTWKGCRAFNYSDDGFDPSGQPYRIFDNCWAMASDRYIGLGSWNIEGNGFKATGADPKYVPDYQVGEENFAIYKNCLAVECNGPGGGVGFYNNILVDYEDLMPNGGLLYNNLAYKNGIGYSDANASIFRNNIVYDSQQMDPTGEKYEVSLYQTWVDLLHNTWIGVPNTVDWWWEYNPDYTVTDNDFVNLDTSQLMRPRKADYSLPDITFGHLAQGSDLIDTGIVVPGYHCSTAGSHPGQNCVEWYGAAPDLGPFESNY